MRSSNLSAFQRAVNSVLQRSVKAKYKEFKCDLCLTVPHAVHQTLGTPAAAYKCIHVTGTNGKGSLCHKLSNALQVCGYNVGMFTSPHISSVRERLQVNGVYVSESQFVDLTETVLMAEAKTEAGELSFFELMTCMGFCHFQRQQVDFAIVECGLGGKWDSTNILSAENVCLSAMTSVALDHTRILGDTVEEIATDKAGIIKENTPIVIGPTVPREVVYRFAEEKNADVHCVERVDDGRLTQADYNLENTRIAQKCMDLLIASGFVKMPTAPIREQMQRKLLESRPLCRFEEVRPKVHVSDSGTVESAVAVECVMDAAHNPQGMDAFFAKLTVEYPATDYRYRAVFGACRRQRMAEMIGPVIRHCEDIHLIQATTKRALEIAELIECCEEFAGDSEVVKQRVANGLSEKPTLHFEQYTAVDEDGNCIFLSATNELIEMQTKDALNKMARHSSESDSRKEVLVAIGSCYIMAPIRNALGVSDAPIDCKETFATDMELDAVASTVRHKLVRDDLI